MNYYLKIIILAALSFTACQPQSQEQQGQNLSTNTEPAPAPPETAAGSSEEAAPEPRTAPGPTPSAFSDADKVLYRTVAAHGGERYNSANYSFVFRDKTYTFQNDGKNFRYTVTHEKNGTVTVDVLDNGQLTRTVDETETELSEKDIAKYGEALNSVVYFATLPHKLLDPAVQLTLLPPANIKGRAYYTLMVQFAEEGGGVDHDDSFRYWINQKTDRIDYLAYDYKTNGGGVRFRSAYNPRLVDGIVFQDYVNYKAPIGTDLDDLTAMFNRGELEELSRIETEQVTVFLD